MVYKVPIVKYITSFIDYPNEISFTVFTYGCNYKCFYCFNYLEITNPDNIIGDLVDIVEKNYDKNLHTAITIIGGEPTIHKKLKDVLLYLSQNFTEKIKLYTNGFNKKLLAEIIRLNLITALSIDLKGYTDISKIIGKERINKDKYINNIFELYELAKQENIDVELRLTKHELFYDKDFNKIIKILKDRNYKYEINKYLKTDNFNLLKK